MKLKNYLFLGLGIIGLTACSSTGSNSALSFGKTYAEEQAAFTYVPLEPTLVKMTCAQREDTCNNLTKENLLNGLPDNSVRLATRKISGKGNLDVGFIGASVGTEGSTYDVIIDFVNTQTVNVQFLGYWQGFERDKKTGKITDRIRNEAGQKTFIERPINTDGTVWKLVILDRLGLQNENKLTDGGASFLQDSNPNENLFNIPTYLGIGLRLKATVTVTKGNVDLSNLVSIAAAVEADKASGTLSVQTIGVTGKTPRESLQLLNKIDDTTIQSAIQSLASIKASIDGTGTTITPRVVGIQNTIGVDSSGINILHSYLAASPLELILNENAYAHE